MFKRNKNKENKRNKQYLQTKITQIDLEELERTLYHQESLKSSLKTNNTNNKNRIEDINIKFTISVDYRKKNWKVNRTLNEFISQRQELSLLNDENLFIPPFQLFPYGNSTNKNDLINSAKGKNIKKCII